MTAQHHQPRVRIRTTADIKPGMVIRLDFSSQPFQQVATVKPGPRPNTRYITFTDGAGQWFHISTGWTVARGKTARKAAKTRASRPQQTGVGGAIQMLGTYTYALLGMRMDATGGAR